MKNNFFVPLLAAIVFFTSCSFNELESPLEKSNNFEPSNNVSNEELMRDLAVPNTDFDKKLVVVGKDNLGEETEYQLVVGPEEKNYIIRREENQLIQPLDIGEPVYVEDLDNNFSGFCIINNGIKTYVHNQDVYLEDGEVYVRLSDMIPLNELGKPQAVIVVKSYSYLKENELIYMFSALDHGDTTTGFIFKIDLDSQEINMIESRVNNITKNIISIKDYNGNFYILYTDYFSQKYEIEIRNIEDLEIIDSITGELKNGEILDIYIENDDITLSFIENLETKEIIIE